MHELLTLTKISQVGYYYPKQDKRIREEITMTGTGFCQYIHCLDRSKFK